MVDFHTHCLPGIDDGAKDLSESLEMLRQTAEQGIHTVVATPHFYSGNESVASFLERRRQAKALLDAGLEAMPELKEQITVLLGAEVLLRRDISSLDLSPLCMEGTRRILIELPFFPFPTWVGDELDNIVYTQRLDVILAHVDRYIPYCSREHMASLVNYPKLAIQLNGGALLASPRYKTLRQWVPDRRLTVFGSDMHHAQDRVQNLQETQKRLKRTHQGRIWLQRAEDCQEKLLPPSLRPHHVEEEP